MPYPVATYEAIELYDDLRGDATRSAQEDRAHVRLDLNLDAMSEEERRAAAKLLQQALAQLVSPPPPPAGKADSEAETREPGTRDANPDAA
jgi:beta-lactamase class A